MTYSDALKKLAQLGPELRVTPGVPPRKFSLDLVRTLLRALDSPQAAFPSVLIAGTNGKGSTSVTLASIARAAGLRVGLYTSPHLLRVNERIRVATSAESPLQDISDESFGRVFMRVDTAAEDCIARGELTHYPSFFELLTAMAFVYFAEQQIHLAVLEVGLGGRLDATNVVEPVVSVITDIAMDHMEYLGHTLGEIATEKAGILRQNGVLVTLSQHPEANAAIGTRAVELNVRGVDASRFLPPRGFAGEPVSDDGGQNSPLASNRYDLPFESEILHVDSPLAGQHQQRNLALAIAAAVELRTNQGFTQITNEAIERGINNTAWPGRLEWLPGRLSTSHQRHAPLLLDVAHNPAGAWALRWALAQLPEALPRTLLFSCLADKQIEEMARILLPLFDATSGDPMRAQDHIVFAPIQNPRAASVDRLLAVAAFLDIPAHVAPHVPAALTQAESLTPANGLIVVTGSIFLIGEVRALAFAEQVA